MLSTLRAAARSRIVSPAQRIRLRRDYASVTELSRLPKPGDRLHGFTLQRSEHFSETELSALHFQHDKTGADYLHIARDDNNNVFGIGFKTNPPDATGVPHILEHTTLCGSQKYPVRDPFFKMMPRSLQNFMNAFTSSEHTTYPFATTNAQDFKNLMGVYLDATLNPLLKETDFVQEGWRIGPENPKAEVKDEKGSDLVFKGVVYNEMKGQSSDAGYLYYIRFMEHIFPAINNSGGDPAKMTDLTYEQLKNFHAAHYHPSNSKIITYGDQPVEDHLRFLDDQLASFNKQEIDTDIKTVDLLDGPKSVTVKGPIDTMTSPDSQFKTSVSWLTCDPNDTDESTGLAIALNLLIDGYGSPLYRALIESGLGTDFSPNTGLLNEGRRGIFSVGLTGVREENVPKVKEAILEAVREAVAKGLEAQKVEGLLHQTELGLKHQNVNFGLKAVQRLIRKWFNGLDPYEALAVKADIDRFKANYAQPGYLEGLLTKYLLVDNTFTFTMAPSTTYAAELAEEEANRLKSKIAEAVKSYSSEDEAYKQLRERELALVREQDAGRTASLDSLPTLRVTDIPREKPETEVRDGAVDSVKVQWRETATNGLTYFRALALFEDLPTELRMLVPLFTDSIMRIGTKNKTVEQIEDLIKLKTGGISFGHHATCSPYDTQKVEEGFALTGYAFDENVPAMYELMQTVLFETDFDSPHAARMIKQLLRTGADGVVDGIASSGHSFAMRYTAAALSPDMRMAEQTSGLTQVKLITALAAAEDRPEAMAELISKLKTIQSIVVANMRAGQMRVALTCGADATSANESALQNFMTTTSKYNLPTPSVIATGQSQLDFTAHQKTLFNLPYQVSYSAIAVPTAPYSDQSTAPIAILAKLLTHKHLHPEIREKGGAYGGGAYTRSIQGIFGMYSYRDPNPTNTLRIYNEAAQWAAEQEWSDRELEEAKLSIFQGVDAPRSVNSEGMTRFLTGIDHKLDQKRRQWLLDVTAKDVKEAARRIGKSVEEKAYITVLGNAEKQKFHREGDEWKVEDMGLAKEQPEVVAEEMRAKL
ncbi:hypothetical protein DOTSEDRAFT_75346 [Dothistroma septosporum NZE10]|uniref:Presequence protease, mitochondrial n=1 Tax=Dothistroma septosporum (strain NZE10 / CBS 128990) TaxID=675120 RepID=M2Y2Z9_DOTSN|nr:hypothetical protein DOTSEDRAFT_75346 [Dothistroma septosporum NZE10]